MNKRWMLVTREEREIVEYHRRRALKIESARKRRRKPGNPIVFGYDVSISKSGIRP